MTTQAQQKHRVARVHRSRKRIAFLSLVLLISGVVLGRNISAPGEAVGASEVVYPLRIYTVVWGPRSFDEAVWRGVEWVANLAAGAPTVEERFQVEIRSATDAYPPVIVAFGREDLDRLARGLVAPEVFIREHMEFR